MPGASETQSLDDPISPLIRRIGLSRTQGRIFTLLASSAGVLVPRDKLLGVISGNSPHTLDSHIMEIRRKLKQHENSGSIETVKGSGFILRFGPRSHSALT
jgi:DNA-binding response OmpR family regulator